MSIWATIGKSMAAEAGTQVGAGIGGVLGYGIGEIFGHNKRARRQQLEQQSKLNQLSLDFNKKQMNYAQELEKQMYDYTFDKNKPENLKNLYKEAGLNPALMYGTSAGGVSGTSVGTGRGGGFNSQAADEQAIIESNMALMQMGLQMKKLESEIEVNKSTANKNNADADLSSAKKETEDKQRDAFVTKLFYEGKIEWLHSIMEKLKLSIGGPHTEPGKDYFSIVQDDGPTKIYGGFSVPYDMKTSIFYREIMGAVEASEALADNHIANTALTNEKLKWYFTEMMADIAAKDSQAALNKAKELESKWDIGEHINWKTILESGVDSVNTIINLMMHVKGGGLKGTPKYTPPRTVINNYNTPKNNAPRKYSK